MKSKKTDDKDLHIDQHPLTQFVHMRRSVEPEKQFISHEIKLKHQKSIKEYPNLNLSESEYVIKSVRRHLIGMVPALSIGIFLMILSFFMLFNINNIVMPLESMSNVSYRDMFLLIIILFMILVVLGCYLAYYIFTNNCFYLTNESVIQELQITLLSKKEQTVSLMNIEDASYTQNGLIQQLFNFGSIRLSTEGDETTYIFTYVANPKDHIATLNNAVESFKNGRPITSD